MIPAHLVNQRYERILTPVGPLQGHCWFGKHPALSCRTPVGQPWISNQPALGHFHCRVHARQGSVPELTLQQQPRQLPATNCRQRLCSQLHCVAAETDIAEASTAADQYSSHLGVPELQHSSTAPVSQPDVTIKLVETAEELQAVAQLRADAYYAVSPQATYHLLIVEGVSHDKHSSGVLHASFLRPQSSCHMPLG